MNGILVIDKPAGLTSHDVVASVRRILKTKRVGHTGTLDPFATGVMVILVGQATRLAQFLDKDVKEYEALVRFGFETDTGDRTGTRRDVETQGRGDAVTTKEIERVLPQFRGDIEQTPPMYSAKKVDGKKLYELARKGEIIDRKPVKITIGQLEILEAQESVPPAVAGGLMLEEDTIRIRVVCSAGTYIRTLAEDIGRSVGKGAHLTELRRTGAGKFCLETALTLEELGMKENPDDALIPMNEAVSHLPAVVLNSERVGKTKSGLSTRFVDAEFANGAAIRMLDEANELVAIGFFEAVEKVVQPKVVLI
jgi:tRNA pseudouridine55 synthase